MHLLPTRGIKLRKKLRKKPQSRVLALLRQSPTSSARQLAALLGLRQRAVELQLAGRLEIRTAVEAAGARRGGPLGGTAVTHKYYVFNSY